MTRCYTALTEEQARRERWWLARQLADPALFRAVPPIELQDSRHVAIYSLMRTQSEPLDFCGLALLAMNHRCLHQVGGVAYISSLMDCVEFYGWPNFWIGGAA